MKNVVLTALVLLFGMGAGSAFSAAVIDSLPIVTEGDVDAKLVRNQNVLSVEGTVFGLEPGDTHTVWWIVFEGPVPLVLNATGGIANAAGELHFAAALPRGTYGPGETVPRQVLVPGSMENPFGATVVFDVIGHGPPIPGLIDDQISTIDGGCDENGGCTFEAQFIFGP